MNLRKLLWLTAARGGNQPSDKIVLVAGYAPERRSSTGPAATLNKQSGATSQFYVLATNSTDPAALPIESKDGIDTGDWNFVPIVLPEGATGFTISTEGELKSRVLWFNNTEKETINNKGAKVLSGKSGAQGLDQDDYTPTYTYTVPEVTGINSFCCAVLVHNQQKDVNTDQMNLISLEFTYT